MRTAIYLGLAVLTLATLALWAEARQVDGRIEDLTVTLSQAPDGEVYGVLNNSSKGLVTAWTRPAYVEVWTGTAWIAPQDTSPILPCGNIDVRSENVAVGRKTQFPVYHQMGLVKEGETVRVSVHALSGFNKGRVVSNPIQFSKVKWDRQFPAPPSGSLALPAIASPAPPGNR